ncbi:MAG: hypothetical protein CSB47_10370 [Proteobacteria bacterium]|nr:MAG: hypothetical protein CSB47_10370 [Pseudomonadota bacterium]
MNNLTSYVRARNIGKMPSIELHPINIAGLSSLLVSGGYLTHTVSGNVSLSILVGITSAAALWVSDRYVKFSSPESNSGYHPLTDPPDEVNHVVNHGKMDTQLTATYREVFKDESIVVELGEPHPRFITHIIWHDDVNLSDARKLRTLARKLNIETEVGREPPFQIIYSMGGGASGIVMPKIIPQGEQPSIIPFDPSFIKKGKLISFLGIDVRGRPISNDRSIAPHGQATGTTNSGKTVAIRNQIFSDWLAFPESIIYSIDYKSGIKSAPHSKFTSDMIEGVQMILEFRELARRNWEVVSESGLDNWFEFEEKYPGTLPPIFLNIDEYPQLVSEGDRSILEKWQQDKIDAKSSGDAAPVKPELVNDIMGEIVRVYRAGGAFVFIGGQKFPAKEYPTSFTDMFDCRIAMRVVDGDASRQAVDVAGAENLPDRGGMMFRLASNPIQVGAAAFMTSDARKELLKKTT